MGVKFIGKWDKKERRIKWFSPEVAQQIKEIHYIQTDEIPPTMSHATSEGKIFTSKSKLFQHYKDHGFECTGGDHLTGKGVADFRYISNHDETMADVAESLRKIKWGMAPLTEKEKEICRREEQQYRE